MLAGTAPAQARDAYVEGCSAFLTAHWREAASSHPIDPRTHVVVIAVNVPIHPVPSGQGRYARAVKALKQSFPSFVTSPLSGLLTGCCAVPAYGAISPRELTRLSETRFVPLCTVARRIGSTSAGLRIQYRSAYQSGGGEPYFMTYWHRKRLA
jgi:hypothetical protein